MFAGEGTPGAHQPPLPLSRRRARGGAPLDRLRLGRRSTARTRDARPDIYGKIGNSGVSIATLDDMKKLYSGFDLCLPTTSVSMTINGPAPIILAMFMNTAIDQQVEKISAARTARWGAARARRSTRLFARHAAPRVYRATCRRANDGLGPRPARRHRRPSSSTPRPTRGSRPQTLQPVRGTVQADILKEDQAQNTCIFSTEFALRMMGDVQQYFVDQRGAQLLLGVDLRLPHRRGRREPDLAARLHARQRLHHRRVLPRARHEDRRLRAEPALLLLQRHGSRVRGDRPRRAAHLGARDARALRRRAAQPDAEVPHPDLRPHPARAGDPASTTSAPRCRRCTRCSTTATACTPTPTTRRSRRRPRSACAARWRSS